MSLLGKGCDEQMLIGECPVVGNVVSISADMLQPGIIAGIAADTDQPPLKVRIFFFISEPDPTIIAVCVIVLLPLSAEKIKKGGARRLGWQQIVF